MSKNNEVKGNAQEGFFVTLPDETNTFRDKNMVNNGRTGVFYKKEELVSTLNAHKTLVDMDMHIVQVAVPNHAIIHPNCKKFGIKKGESVPIIKIQHFKEALDEMQLQA
jgi:hypothetical protein